MKKIIALGVLAFSVSAFATPKEGFDVKGVGNYIVKNSCLDDHFKGVEALIGNHEAKQVNDSEKLGELKKNQKVVSFQDNIKVITGSLSESLKGTYLLTRKDSKQETLFVVNKKNISSLKSCFVLLDEVAPQGEVKIDKKNQKEEVKEENKNPPKEVKEEIRVEEVIVNKKNGWKE